jgi:hypothetical protein
MWFRKFAFLAVLLIAVTSCTDDQDSEITPEPTKSDGSAIEGETPADATVTPVDLATISPSESRITGSLFSIAEQNQGPLQDSEVRLAKVYWNDEQSEGAFVIDETTDPATISDDEGIFAFAKLEARDYVIVVGDLYGQNVIIANSDGSARIFKTQLGETLDVGVLQVDLASAPAFPATPIPYPPPITTATPFAYPLDGG